MPGAFRSPAAPASMGDFLPEALEVEARAVLRDMAIGAGGGTDLGRLEFAGILDVLGLCPVAALAADVHQVRRLRHGLKAALVLQADDVTGDAVGVLVVLGLDQRLPGVGVGTLLPRRV